MFDGVEYGTHWGIDQFPQKYHADGQDGKHKIIKTQRAFDLDVKQTEKGQWITLDAHQTVFATGNCVPLESDKKEHLGKGNGQQRMINAPFFRMKYAQHCGDDCTAQNAAPKRYPNSFDDVMLKQTEKIGAATEKKAMAERR